MGPKHSWGRATPALSPPTGDQLPAIDLEPAVEIEPLAEGAA